MIEYRKRCIASEAIATLETGGIGKVVIAGAGVSMLGIELAARFRELSVFETDADAASMARKRVLVAGLGFAEGSRLQCLEADARDLSGTRAVLGAAGWGADLPTLLIVEGLSYYITKEALRRHWRALAPASRIILEYLVPPADVGEARRCIPERVFGLIREYGSSEGEYPCWREGELRLEEGLQVERLWAMEAIEGELAVGDPLFSRREDGWIEIALMRRGEAHA
ncbi:class I SAM-dependent methyltransferase [Chlorobium sp. N1]|uniref:class I SAM-dependent methyltransferase n=1 Tax=Chlorobium sp. N1 TaxID=2491138 RepID=UPI0013F16572|nr:class I SAM-dependent methyltransferase [Chlorobium sp. N1]